jgi:hypothetical protein
MGSGCSIIPTTTDDDNTATMAILPTICHPTVPAFQLSATGAVDGQKRLMALMDMNGDLIIQGWALKQDRTIPGKSVFENTYTGERISWVPLQSASKERGMSFDIESPCVHYKWNTNTLQGLQMDVDEEGRVGVIDVDPNTCPWGVDSVQVKYQFVCMINGMAVKAQKNIEEFDNVVKKSYRTNGCLHVLFSTKNGSVYFPKYVDRNQDADGIDSYSLYSSGDGLGSF